jgi:enamine deaminase RidA (YjgF/YER057c/UK114 family)
MRAGETKLHTVIVTPEFAHYPSEWHFSPGLDTGDFVFFSGITGTRSDLSIAAEPEMQFREAFRILQANLVQARLAMSDVVEITSYHVNLRQHLNAFMKVKDEYVAEPYPAWTAVGVAELITDGALVEIRAIAKRR